MKAYDSRGDKCSIVHYGVIGQLLDGATEKFIDPEGHRIDQDEHGQLDADQNREEVLRKSSQNMRLERSARPDRTAYIRKMFFGGPTRLKVTVR
jgi:hypothetical protein